MKNRILESDTRMKYLLGNNPIGELIRIVSNVFKNKENIRQKMTT